MMSGASDAAQLLACSSVVTPAVAIKTEIKDALPA